MEWLNSNGERRQHPRFSVKLPLDYWETPDVLKGGLVVDISELGLYIHPAHSIQTGAELRTRVSYRRRSLLPTISKEVAKSSGELSIGKHTGEGINMGYISQK